MPRFQQHSATRDEHETFWKAQTSGLRQNSAPKSFSVICLTKTPSEDHL